MPTVLFCLRYSRASWSTSVLFPEPGDPVRPITCARPLWGNNSRSKVLESEELFSIALMARASARTSPARTRSLTLELLPAKPSSVNDCSSKNFHHGDTETRRDVGQIPLRPPRPLRLWFF